MTEPVQGRNFDGDYEVVYTANTIGIAQPSNGWENPNANATSIVRTVCLVDTNGNPLGTLANPLVVFIANVI